MLTEWILKRANTSFNEITNSSKASSSFCRSVAQKSWVFESSNNIITRHIDEGLGSQPVKVGGARGRIASKLGVHLEPVPVRSGPPPGSAHGAVAVAAPRAHVAGEDDVVDIAQRAVK